MRYRITRGGEPVTRYQRDQTKLMHLYVLRSDLTGFQHVHPSLTGGVWAARLAALKPGTYRVYAQFATAVTGKPLSYALGARVTVAGKATKVALPPPSRRARVDGYTVDVTGAPMAGMRHELVIQVKKNGKPVRDLEPYLDTFAHVTAVHAGDMRFAHLHPAGGMARGHGGPVLPLDALLPKAGNWRVFIQFQTDGQLHTAALTLAVR